MYSILKKMLACLLALLLLLSLAGCGGTEQPEPTGEASPQQTNPSHITQMPREDILIDAEIICPSGSFVPKVYTAELPMFSPEMIDDLLTLIGDQVTEVQVDRHVDDLYNYAVHTEKGGFAVILQGEDVDNPSSGFSYSAPGDEWYNNVFFSPRRKSGYLINYNGHLYLEPKEFSFATAAEAEAKAREALAVLGVKDPILEETYYLDYETMAAEEQAAAEYYNTHFAEIEGRDYQCKDSWSEADNCYLFQFCTGADGLVLSKGIFDSPAVNYYSSSITVRYNAAGISFIGVERPWQAGAPVEAPEAILSAEEALALADQRIEQVLLEEDQVIDEAALRYMYFQDGDRWLLRPVWEIQICKKDVASDVPGLFFDEYYYLAFDAVTGEDLF